MSLVKKVKNLLNKHGGKGTKTFSEEVMEEYLEGCKLALESMLAESKFKFPRPSSLNHGARKMYYMKNEPELFTGEQLPYNLRITFFQGHALEAMLIALARTAGVKMDAVQKYTETNIGDVKVGGTLDYIVDGEIRDAKTANDRAYTTKWKNLGSLEQHDPYGYIRQAAFYSYSEELPFTGWDVINKNTGELKEISAKDANFGMEMMQLDGELKEAFGNAVPGVCHQPVEEVYRPRGKPVVVTGNKQLHANCVNCPVRLAGKCSPAKIVAEGKRSTGNNVYYTEFNQAVNPHLKVVIKEGD